MPLKSTTVLPPGGWIYEQKDNEGKVVKKFRSMAPFKDAATEIKRVRVNNKFARASLNEVMEDLEAATCERLGFDPKWCAVKKKSFPFTPVNLFKASPFHLRENAQAAGQRIGQLASGAQILSDWIGEGAQPVPIETAQARADVCTGRLTGHPCPFNRSGFKPVEGAAERIRLHLERKNELDLRVEGEENLHTCDICWCHLPLKVHVPISSILAGTPDNMLLKFQQAYPACWIVTENQTPQNT